jgi:hypothetical protein
MPITTTGFSLFVARRDNPNTESGRGSRVKPRGLKLERTVGALDIGRLCAFLYLVRLLDLG